MTLPDTTAVIQRLALLAILVFALRTFSENQADVDLWGNVGFVKALPGAGGYHDTNTFSFTEQDHPWVNHEWLAEYIFFRVFQRAGNSGLLALKLLLGFSLLAVMNLAMRSGGLMGITRFLFLLLILSTMGYGYSTRPHHFTYLLCAIFLYVLTRYPDRQRLTMILLPLLGIAWANLHGAFFIGAILLVFHAADRLRSHSSGDPIPRRLFYALAPLALFFAATLVNPYGLRLWDFIFQSAGIPRPYLSEWGPFNPLKHFWIHPDFVALSLFTGIGVWKSRAPRNPVWIAALCLGFLSALWLRRNIPLFAITTAMLASTHVQSVMSKPLDHFAKSLSRGLVVLCLVSLIAISLLFTVSVRKSNPLEIEVDRGKYPVELMDFMRETRLSGNAIVFFDWAEYAIWHLYPDCRIFMDGRFRSAYSQDVIRTYFDFLYARPGWERALDSYPTDIVLIHKGNPVFEKMMTRPGWILIREDSISGLFLLAEKHGPFLEQLAPLIHAYPQSSAPVYFP